MNWIILIVAGLCEVGFTYCLGRAKAVTGMEWWAWMGGFLVFTVASMGFFLIFAYNYMINLHYTKMYKTTKEIIK